MNPLQIRKKESAREADSEFGRDSRKRCYVRERDSVFRVKRVADGEFILGGIGFKVNSRNR